MPGNFFNPTAADLNLTTPTSQVNPFFGGAQQQGPLPINPLPINPQPNPLALTGLIQQILGQGQQAPPSQPSLLQPRQQKSKSIGEILFERGV